MLMIGTAELAERLYEAWRKQMDLTKPIVSDQHYDGRYEPRSKWVHLDTNHQAVWKNVARELGSVLADAMGAA